MADPFPSAEALGYWQWSLRDPSVRRSHERIVRLPWICEALLRNLVDSIVPRDIR
jgi:hypothetical protein